MLRYLSEFLRGELPLIGRFCRDRRGNIAIITAAALIPLLGFVGAAIDYGSATQARTSLQNALDAASLAVNKAGLDPSISDGQLQQIAQDTIAANYKLTTNYTLTTFDVDRAAGRVQLAATSQVPTNLIGIMGFDTIDFNSVAESVIGSQSLEIVMVLDNSGSMSGSKISDLRTAAKNLTNTMFASQAGSNVLSVKMGIVPFAGLVNVGANNASAAWMDTSGASSVHNTNFTGGTNRFDLYAEMDNISWGGCVEARPYPLDVDDTVPTAANPDTLFVPSFAPDEYDSWGSLNNYISQNNAPFCPQSGGKWKPSDWQDGLKNTCKYQDSNYNEQLAYGTRKGPNFLCDAQPITPLTDQQNTIVNSIDGMNAYGGTNIAEAMAWGWRVISPSAPFTEGAAYGDATNRKFLILMSDGANWAAGQGHQAMSMYSAWGYAYEGRLGAPTSSTSTLRSRMNTRTLEACNNAKAAGITLYTIAFEVTDPTTLQLLTNCASAADQAFQATSGSDLIAKFQDIADQISQLRLSK